MSESRTSNKKEPGYSATRFNNKSKTSNTNNNSLNGSGPLRRDHRFDSRVSQNHLDSGLRKRDQAFGSNISKNSRQLSFVTLTKNIEHVIRHTMPDIHNFNFHALT